MYNEDMRILLVEDEVRLSQALVEIFQKNRYGVDAVYTGPEGLQYAQSGIYDIIVLDIMLPGMDGISVLSLFWYWSYKMGHTRHA